MLDELEQRLSEMEELLLDETHPDEEAIWRLVRKSTLKVLG
jgi:hypothetical protein